MLGGLPEFGPCEQWPEFEASLCKIVSATGFAVDDARHHGHRRAQPTQRSDRLDNLSAGCDNILNDCQFRGRQRTSVSPCPPM